MKERTATLGTLCATPPAACAGAPAHLPAKGGRGPQAPAAPQALKASLPQTAKKTGDAAKKAILVASFGTSYGGTREAAIGAIEAAIGEAYPGWEVRRAFTSQMIIDKLAARDGLQIDNVGRALERLVSDGVGTVVVQPTHVLYGHEYDGLVQAAAPYARCFNSLHWGAPLLSSTADYRALAKAIAAEIAVPAGGALCLVGHGTTHLANIAYAALDDHFKLAGRQDIFVGTVEGYPGLAATLGQVRALGAKQVVLAPLMVVAGGHARNDMAGDGEGTWETAFKAQGYGVEVVLKGLGEYPAVRGLYVAHVAQAIAADQAGEG